jgi:hypothetical protein
MSNLYPGVITEDYNHQPMGQLNAADYETLLITLADQLGAKLGAYRANATGDEIKSAVDALAAEWRPERTGRQWLAASGARLGIDTVGCAGL